MRIDRRVAGMLKNLGAQLVRTKKHLVYRVPGHRNVVLSHTPSDVNAVKQQVADIKKLMPELPKSPKSGERRARHDKPGRYGEQKWSAGPERSPLADQLRVVGVTEQALRLEIQQLKSENGVLRSEMGRCWGCRLRRWICRFRQ